jgi:hypothetical protein
MAILRLTAGFSDGIHPIRHLASLLGSGKRLKLNRTDLETRVDTEVVSGNGGSYETRLGRLESDSADLNAPDNLVFQPLVVDLNIVVTIEIPLGVVVHVDVHPAAYGAARAEVHLIVEPRCFEAAAAARIPVEQQGGTAALVPEPVGTELEPDLAIECKVGILRRQPQHAPTATGRLHRVSRSERSGLAVQCQCPVRGGPLGSCRVKRYSNRAVPRQACHGRRAPRGSQPWSPKLGGLAQGERGLRESQLDPWKGRVSPGRIDLTDQESGERGQADEGEE